MNEQFQIQHKVYGTIQDETRLSMLKKDYFVISATIQDIMC